jgi:hypothetical protein
MLPERKNESKQWRVMTGAVKQLPAVSNGCSMHWRLQHGWLPQAKLGRALLLGSRHDNIMAVARAFIPTLHTVHGLKA